MTAMMKKKQPLVSDVTCRPRAGCVEPHVRHLPITRRFTPRFTDEDTETKRGQDNKTDGHSTVEALLLLTNDEN